MLYCSKFVGAIQGRSEYAEYIVVATRVEWH